SKPDKTSLTLSVSTESAFSIANCNKVPAALAQDT
ncbi:unnamed protein product, partial [marine sediment metagenome]